MNAEELRKFIAERKPSAHVERHDVAHLTCYGCAHSAALAPPPSHPSGERPCCSCVRNPDREKWAEDRAGPLDELEDDAILIGDDGHARVFNPFLGTLYNGAPAVYHPMDRYVTMDSSDQADFLDEHPEYAKSVRVDGAGNLTVVDD